MHLKEDWYAEPPWELYQEGYHEETAVTAGSNLMIGNGYLGYRGTFADDRAGDFAGLVVTDTWDNADGKWRELVTAPNPLFVSLAVQGHPRRSSEAPRCRRGVDFRYGYWKSRAEWDDLVWEEQRFASYADLHLLISRHVIRPSRDMELEIRSGIDPEVWSLNGNHFLSVEPGRAGDGLFCEAVTQEQGIRIHAASRFFGPDRGPAPEPDIVPEVMSWERRRVSLKAGGVYTFEVHAALYTSRDLLRRPPERSVVSPLRKEVEQAATPAEAAAGSLARAGELGFADLSREHQARWDRFWGDMDVVVGGDDYAQFLLRYNLYLNWIAAPLHADHLPIGARGLSCQAYQGAAFWDEEIFNLPLFLYTCPEAARNILIYRYRTLQGAREKAANLGYAGAFYAWVSADTGEEICPSYFFKDVLSGRRIRNHFNDWQIHISPDIAYTVKRYVEVTGDTAFLADYGAEMVIEIARFLASRIHFRPWLDRYELLRVLGPDEYHENVDDNFFTNFQARFALAYAAEVVELMESRYSREWGALSQRLGCGTAEAAGWRDMSEKLYLPDPGERDGLIEAFRGFFALEDISPDDLAERLLNKGEYWGWPNGIAVETQVSKQADVVQLFMLHPEAYPPSVMRANWDYYEPRTQHGSSLSPAVYAITAAWVGYPKEAYRYFERACTVDLYNANKAVSGGTFIGGIHTAAAGAAWQIAVIGFAGLHLTATGIGFRPRLPESWSELRFRVKYRGALLEVSFTPEGYSFAAPEENPTALRVTVPSGTLRLAPGQQVAGALG